ALIPALAPSLNAAERGLDLSLKTDLRFPTFPENGLRLAHAANSSLGGGGRVETETKGPDRLYMAGRGDASYPGLSIFPNTFKNGEVFHVAKTSGIPDGLPMLRVEEKKDLSTEDILGQDVEAH